jgi:2-polyprenyl-6-methoxyphenol hydroxylase-like FAD-dependent oxidoreductase
VLLGLVVAALAGGGEGEGEFVAKQGLVEKINLGKALQLQARLLVAADSRFSQTRRLLGIGAQLKDFGKTMLVCRMDHEKPHRQTAWEWFGYGQTLALLPLNGEQSSVVLTLPAEHPFTVTLKIGDEE